MKKDIIKIIIAAILFAYGVTCYGEVKAAILIAAYLIAGYETIITAIRNILHGQVFDENFLMTVASGGAIFLGSYSEAVAVMLFYRIGEFFEDYAVNKSRKSIADLMDICPEKAHILIGDKVIEAEPEEVNIGDILLIRPGEKIPVDSVIIKGSSTVNMAALTGESVPVSVNEGDKLISGGINLTGVISARAEKRFEESVAAKVLELVEDAASKKAPVENFITKFAKVYTPIVVFSALALAVLPPLITNDSFSTWAYRACLFLVVSCPCALVISVPMSFFSGIGAASSKGVLVKGGNYLQLLAGLETVMFDKTGTLTTGSFRISEIESEREDFLRLAASIEQYSNHPIAICIADKYEGEIYKAEEIKEYPGKGISAIIDNTKYYAGNAKLMKELGIETEDEKTTVYVASEKEYLGKISVEDRIKDEAVNAINELKLYVSRIVMLTGDNGKIADEVAEKIGIEEVYKELLPTDKVKIAERIIKETGGACAFAGDGINDAPVLARTDLGIAMGGLGADSAMEAADIVIMDDDLTKICLAVRIGRKTLKLCRENIWFAIGVKTIVLVLGALGLVNMWAAVFADVGVAVLCILNSMRALKVK